MISLPKSILTPLFYSTLLFNIAGHANTNTTNVHNSNPMNEALSKCHAQYHASLPTMTLLKHDKPLILDKEKAAMVETLKRFVHKYNLDNNFANLPDPIYFTNDKEFTALFETDHMSKEKEFTALFETDHMSKEEASNFLLGLYRSYITGEYVPRDDAAAILYLSNVIDYREQENPGNLSGLMYLISMYSLTDRDDNALIYGDETVLSDTDPSYNKKFEERLAALLLKSGSIDMQALFIEKYINESASTCDEVLIKDLVTLADKGSYYAIHGLANIYTQLNNKHPNQYEKQMSYWKAKAKQSPIVNN